MCECHSVHCNNFNRPTQPTYTPPALRPSVVRLAARKAMNIFLYKTKHVGRSVRRCNYSISCVLHDAPCKVQLHAGYTTSVSVYTTLTAHLYIALRTHTVLITRTRPFDLSVV